MNRFCKIWWGTAKMGPLGFLPSGAAMLVYDVEGRLIDWTGDEGDDWRFQRKWSKVETVEIHE